MTVIAVAAPAAGSGKTVLLCRMLEAFPGRLTAVKLSDHLPDAPRGGTRDVRDCACRAPESPFTVIEAPETHGEPRKDTARFAAAGARRVLWCRAERAVVREAWAHLVERHLGKDEIVVAEGGRAAAVGSPALLVFVVNPERPREEWKNDSRRFLEQAQAVVWNRYPRRSDRIETPEEAAAALAEMEGVRPRLVLTGDLARPLGEAFPILHAMCASVLLSRGRR